MPTQCISEPLRFEGFDGRRVEAAFDGGAVTSDAGALLLRETDRVIGLIAACFRDGRDPARIVHSLRTLIGQRIIGLALGYEDLNDHDDLRFDPALALFSDRLERRRADCAALGGKSTVNRLEHAPRDGKDRYRKIAVDRSAVETLLVALFLDAHGKAPRQIVLDLDAVDDPLHGHQEGRFFHGYYGYYGCYCYLPLYVFCGRHLLAAKLRRSNIDASAGAVEEVARIRERWPRVRILLRADSGFAREALMAWCEGHRVDYILGLARNSRLLEALAIDMAWAEDEHEKTGWAVRRFKDFRYATLAPGAAAVASSVRRVSEFPCWGQFRHAKIKRSSNRMASWVLAMLHSRGGIFHSFVARFNTRNKSLRALSSVGKWPLARTARRSLAFKLSIAFVV
jgi:hypothetical protein